MKNTLTPELLAKAKQAKNTEELIALAKENGVELTAESAKAYFDQLHKDGELADDELDSVAGGGKCGTIYHNNRPVVTASNACEHWKCSRCQSTQYRSTTINSFCRQCGCERGCKNCEFSRYEDALLQCFHPLRYDN